jgi:hypothetical protein
MSPPEVPLEKSQEDIAEHAHHATEPWIMGVALTAAILAVLAAITALLSEHHAEEAMICRIKAADKWNYYQAKGIKANLLESKMQMLSALDHKPDSADSEKLDKYKKEQEEISAEATALEHESEDHFAQHSIFARGVTMFQVAIAVGAISVLTRRRAFWFGCMAFGVVGLGFLAQGGWAVHVH